MWKIFKIVSTFSFPSYYDYGIFYGQQNRNFFPILHAETYDDDQSSLRGREIQCKREFICFFFYLFKKSTKNSYKTSDYQGMADIILI